MLPPPNWTMAPPQQTPNSPFVNRHGWSQQFNPMHDHNRSNLSLNVPPGGFMMPAPQVFPGNVHQYPSGMCFPGAAGPTFGPGYFNPNCGKFFN